MADGQQRSSGHNQRRSRRRLKALKPLLIGVPIAVIVFALSFAFMPRSSSLDQEVAAYNAKVAADQKELAAKKAAEEQAVKDARTIDLSFPTGRPLEVMLAGDSLSHGMYSSSEETAFRSLVQAELSKYGPVNWHDINQPGATTKVIAGKPSPATNLDLVIVELGTNDNWINTPVEQFKAAYAGYLDKLRVESPNTRLLCLGPWSKADPGTVELEAAMSEQCVSRGGKFASLSEFAANRSYNSTQGTQSWVGVVSDSSHPDDDGHLAISERILSHLGRLTGK